MVMKGGDIAECPEFVNSLSEERHRYREVIQPFSCMYQAREYTGIHMYRRHWVLRVTVLKRIKLQSTLFVV